MRETKTVTIVGDRPADIPADWTIWNAPRPLYGQKNWTGDFISGRFYSATDPSDPFSEGFERENRRNDAVILAYIMPEEWKRQVYEYADELKTKYKKHDWNIEDYEFEELEASYRNYLRITSERKREE